MLSVIHLPEFAEYRAQCEAAPLRPLRVSATMAAPLMTYHPVHLDGLLAFAVVEMLTQGQGLPNSAAPYYIPLPLRRLWESPTGLPLWAATDLMPEAEAVKSQVYFHRRAIAPTMTDAAIRTGKGRHKEKRSPIPSVSTRTMTADVIGNPDMLAALLKNVASIGKKHHASGAIASWGIEEIETFMLSDEQGRTRRPLPLEMFQPPMTALGQHIGFTPPYWLPAAQCMCIDSGMPMPENANGEVLS